jgi:hypothetical protein
LSHDRVLAAAVFVGCLGLYIATLTPGLCYPSGDSHELTLNALRLGVPHPTGYPVYTWLGFLFTHLAPIGSAAYRMNLMSAVLGAAGVGMLVLVGRRLGLSPVAAVAAALLLGTSTTLWSQAVITEVYAADVGMLALTLWLLLVWADRVTDAGDAAAGSSVLVAFALVLGLSLGTHLSNLGFVPGYALFVLVTAPRILQHPRPLLLALAAFLAGAAQFVWLPLRGGAFDLYPNPPPVTLEGFWVYTLGAFSKLRFAYAPAVLPLRGYFYGQQLVENFSLAGMAVGLVGMWAMLWRHPARFWLLFWIWAVNVVFFSQVAVFDLDVFFLPGYLPWAVFVGFGIDALWSAVRAALHRWGGSGRMLMAARTVGVVVLAGALLAQVRSSFALNDRRTDTAIDDFDRDVFAMVPRGSFLVGRRGVYGADLPYWQRAEGLRPDVTIASQHGARPRPPEASLFTTVPVQSGRPTTAGRQGNQKEYLPHDAWYVPVLFGVRSGLVLSRIDAERPQLTVASPPRRLGLRFGALVLESHTLEPRPDAPRPRVHLTTHWRLLEAAPFVISTRVGDVTLESHELGLGNLERWIAEVGFPANEVLVEDFDVVIPSHLEPGDYPIGIGVTEFPRGTITTHWIEAGHVRID